MMFTSLILKLLNIHQATGSLNKANIFVTHSVSVLFLPDPHTHNRSLTAVEAICVLGHSIRSDLLPIKGHPAIPTQAVLNTNPNFIDLLSCDP